MAKISLSNHQTSIWLEAQIQKGTPIFNIGTFVELNGVPNSSLLERAIQEVIAQNDALRIRVVQSSLSAKQKFLSNADFSLHVKSFKDAKDARQKAQNWMQEEFVIPMKLDRHKLYEICLVILDDSSSYLFFKHHHIYIDGWSRALLVRKIAEQYNALISGIPVKSKNSFANYVELREAKNQNEGETQSLNFWKEQFGDYQRTTLLEKKDKLKANLPSRRKKMVLERGVFNSSKLPGFAAEKGKFYFFLAALYLTLSRERGKKEIVFGVPLLNRFGEEERNTLGYFVGLLPLKLSFEANISFMDLVNGIRNEMAKSRPYRGLSIQEINHAVGVNFTNATQLYDVVFSFEVHDHNCSFGNLDVVEAGTFSSDYEQNPLVIHVQDYIKSAEVHFEFDYNLNYFTGPEVETLISRYKNVIECFTGNVDANLETVEVLFANEIETLNKYATDSSRAVDTKSLVDQILEASKRYSTKTIVRDEKGSLTFGELRAEAEKIAAHIINLSLEKEEAIGVMVPREKESIISILAVLISGACYVPIDPALSTKRIHAMLEDSNAKKIICHSGFDDSDLFDGYQLILPDSIVYENCPEFPSLNGSSQAYIIFTSGSTGRPKGVKINHSNVSNLIEALNEEIYSNYPDDIVLALLSSFNFDASIQQLFACLVLGRELVIVPSNIRQDGKLLAEFLSTEGIGICDGIPTHLLSMITRTSAFEANSKLRHLVIGGESFSAELAQRLFDWLGNLEVKVSNVYGPTECTVDSTIHTFDRRSFLVGKEIPIGRPINNTSIWILDQNEQLLPPGAMGEICIAGAGLSIGYSNDPELTESKFRYNTALGQNLYHSGDLGTWDENGLLLFRGRIDSQVKIRGYRIELGEIEFYLNKIEGADQAIVLVHESGAQKRVVAFVQSAQNIDEDSIKEQLSNNLPGYMIPHFIKFLKVFPLTVTGKIDRNKLLNTNFFDTIVEVNPPSTETEKALATIFEEVLELKGVDVKLGFFSLGGDSMNLMFLLVRIEEEFGRSISMSDFGSMTSVRRIAQYIDSSGEVERKIVSLETEISDLNDLERLQNSDKRRGEAAAFITGATGFVGAFLCFEACKKFERVICLIREENKESAKLKLMNTFSKYDLGVPNWDRVDVVIGDLSAEQLGLTDKDWERLIDVDFIYHAGAEVNFVKDLQSVKKTNINSTFNLLKLCKTGGDKSFNFISTKGVFGEFAKDYSEDAKLDNEVHFANKGYESSKWVADVMASRARLFGIEANVYRLGRITGDSLKGVGRREDFFHRFIEGCIEIKSFPSELMELSTDLTPVDLTVESIVKLSLVSLNENFHLLNNKLTIYQGLVTACSSRGVELEIVGYDSWLTKVEELNSRKADNPLFLITAILKQKDWFSGETNGFDGEITSTKIKNIGIDWPETEGLWQIYVDNCINRILKVNTK